MEKILSLIIPTYNMEKYLNKCLDSLIVDNMNLLEVLVINDGSKDRSSEIAHEYEKKYPKTFRVIDKENGNYGSCINRGLKEATGKYVKVLDADDYFDTANFLLYINWLTYNDADLIITDFQTINEKYETIRNINFNLAPLQDLSFGNLYNYDFIRSLQMHATTYKRENILSLNYRQTEGISYTDQEWMFHPMIKVEKIIYYNKIIYKYLLGREGQTMDPVIVSKQISHTIHGVLNMLDVYNNIRNTSLEVKEYLDYRLLSRISYIYKSLLLAGSSKSYKALDEFDSLLKMKSSYFYEKAANECKIVKLKYIKYWREQSYVVFSLAKLVYKLQLFKSKIQGK